MPGNHLTKEYKYKSYGKKNQKAYFKGQKETYHIVRHTLILNCQFPLR